MYIYIHMFTYMYTDDTCVYYTSDRLSEARKNGTTYIYLHLAQPPPRLYQVPPEAASDESPQLFGCERCHPWLLRQGVSIDVRSITVLQPVAYDTCTAFVLLHAFPFVSCFYTIPAIRFPIAFYSDWYFSNAPSKRPSWFPMKLAYGSYEHPLSRSPVCKSGHHDHHHTNHNSSARRFRILSV